MVFGQALGQGFVYDDLGLIRDNVALADLGTLPEALGHDLFHFASSRPSPYWRPVITASYYLEQALGGGEPWAFHLGNLVALWAAALAWFALVRDRVGLLSAAVVATLVAVHPLVVEPAVNIASRTDVVCLFFVGLALRSERGIWALVLALLACGSKELAVGLPLVAWLLQPQHSRWRWMLLASALFLGARALVLAGHAAPEDPTTLQFVSGAGWRMVWMGGRLLVPCSLPPALTIGPPGPWLALAGWVVLVLLGLGAWRSNATARAGLALVVLALLPVSGLLGAWPRYGDGLLVLPLAGAALALAPVLQRNRVVAWSLTPLLIGLALMSRQQVPRWASEEGLWRWSHELRPDDPQLRLNLARSSGSEHEALSLTEGLVHPVPRVQREVHTLRAHALLARSPQDARAEAARACSPDPEAAWACSVACVFGPAVQVCRLASELAPDDANVWNSLGIVLGGADRAQAFARACELSPEEGPFCDNARRSASELQAVPGDQGGLP